MRSILFAVGLLVVSELSAQGICGSDQAFKILHFTKTSGFDHGTRQVSAQMFAAIGMEENFTIENTSDASVFDDLNDLMDYAAVVFSNTSGNNLLNTTQQANFEQYIDSGKGFLGIHAATDTYRTGWAYYNDLVGAIVQTGPNHTANNYNGTMDAQISHPTLLNIPDPWNKREEYYYWDLNMGMIDTVDIVTTLKVRSTGSQSYDRERPITWFQTFSTGARSFYTALGHAGSNYTSDMDFRQLIRNGICWVAKASSDQVTDSSAARLDMDGDIHFTDQSIGPVLRSPDGSCWTLKVSDTGVVTSVPAVCPQ